jgi:hypothetical protein
MLKKQTNIRKEPEETFKEIFGRVCPEQVNRWHNCMLAV